MRNPHHCPSHSGQPCLGSNRCCRPGRPCILGEGDCDSDGDCALNLVCGDHSACAAGIGGVDDFETGADCCAIDCRDIQAKENVHFLKESKF